MLTVKQLKDFLSQYPDDMEIIETRQSDYEEMKLEDWDERFAINKDYYHMKVYENQIKGMKSEDISKIKKYLHYHGN